MLIIHPCPGRRWLGRSWGCQDIWVSFRSMFGSEPSFLLLHFDHLLLLTLVSTLLNETCCGPSNFPHGTQFSKTEIIPPTCTLLRRVTLSLSHQEADKETPPILLSSLSITKTQTKSTCMKEFMSPSSEVSHGRFIHQFPFRKRCTFETAHQAYFSNFDAEVCAAKAYQGCFPLWRKFSWLEFFQVLAYVLPKVLCR